MSAKKDITFLAQKVYWVARNMMLTEMNVM
jgi:hypothetical protein